MKYEFEGWSFDPSTGELTREGRSIVLPVQVAQLLEALVRSPGELVPREDLYRLLWGDQIVDHEHGLNFCVRQLRIHLGDDARDPEFVETIRGRGYRFVARVERIEQSHSLSGPARLRVRLAAAVMLVGILTFWGSSASSPTIAEHDRAGMEFSRLLQEARYLESKDTVEDLRRAVLRYQSAVARNPESSRAFAGLARGHRTLAMWGAAPRAEAFRSARDAAQAALELDPSSQEAHLSFGIATLYLDFDWTIAAEHFRLAVEGDPLDGEARLWNARAMAAHHRYEEALAEAELALAADPESRMVLSDMAWFSYFAGDFDAAIATSTRVLDLEPRAWASLQCLQLSYLAVGSDTKAREVTETIFGLISDDSKPELPSTPDWIAVAAETINDSCPMRSLSVESARLYAIAGENETAIRLLRKGVEDRVWWTPFITIDPAFAELRSEPGYLEMMRQLDVS